ncbi:MAG: cupin domain-containing protein [Sinobacteraceae bacterium]|nr:cupin domain-containing protein [Nevskiaceae bacterium]
MKPVLNVADAKVSRTMSHGDTFEFRMAEIAPLIGATQIGANLTIVPPGKAAFPFHHHYGNEEHFFILRGSGVLRFGAETYPIKPGDYVVTPAGGPELAHQFVNTGAEELAYLAISTLKLPEIVGYPDSAKTGARTSPEQHFVVANAHLNAGYFDGEDGAQVRGLTKR